MGAAYPITLEASNCDTGEVLARAQAQAAPKEQILRAVEEALARGAAMAGDVPKAQKAYADFLALWKNADPDLPILAQAGKEYRALLQ